jgi:CIC family chloride channel protein
VLLMKRSILTEKVARRGYHVVREYSVSPLARFQVDDVMERDVPTVPADTQAVEIIRRLLLHDPVFGRRHSWPLVDRNGAFVGILTRGDLLEAFNREGNDTATLLDIGTASPIVTYPDDQLEDAIDLMIRSGVGRLPVVDRDDPTRLVGMLSRGSLATAHKAVLAEEQTRHHSWVSSRLSQAARGLRRKAV